MPGWAKDRRQETKARKQEADSRRQDTTNRRAIIAFLLPAVWILRPVFCRILPTASCFLPPAGEPAIPASRFLPSLSRSAFRMAYHSDRLGRARARRSIVYVKL